ncbi:MAG: hypothetical protein J6U39_01180 [Clostridia bacterium]|nr:hypothetical protein [Clostridia bacterium]
MIISIIVSLCFSYYLSLPFASVIQGGGYHTRALLRAKKYLLACGVYFLLSATLEIVMLYLAKGWLIKLLTGVVYLLTGIFVYFIHHLMRIAMHYTARLMRLLILHLPVYIISILFLHFISLGGLWAATPALAPFSLALTNVLMLPIEKRNNRRYINKAASFLRSRSGIKIGVTGSYGKTSVKHYLDLLLSFRYDVFVTPENYNTPLGIARSLESSTGREQIYILEMGARKRGDIAELCDMAQPNIGIITGIAPQHLETFGSVDEIMAEKNLLAESVPREGTVYYNLTDPLVRSLYDFRTGGKVGVGYEKADYLISEEIFTPDGSTFCLSNGGKKVRISIPAVGKACVINFALACAVAIEQGISWESLSAAGSKAIAPPHRYEVVRRDKIIVIDDSYNINPVGAAVALESLKGFKAERRLVYTSGIVELGEEEERYNRDLGAHIAEVADVIIVAYGRYGDEVVRGVGEKENAIFRVKDTAEASRLFGEILKEGDVLLIISDLPRDYLL